MGGRYKQRCKVPIEQPPTSTLESHLSSSYTQIQRDTASIGRLSNYWFSNGRDEEETPPKFTPERTHTTQLAKVISSKETKSVEEVMDMEVGSTRPPNFVNARLVEIKE